MADQATVTWGGVTRVMGFTFAFQPIGIEPSACVIRSPEELGAPSAAGNLVLSYADGSLTFVDCRLERPRLTANNSGRVRDLPILDRRWKWRFGLINGSYNLRQPDDTLKREQTPQQLATLLLEAMGETGFQVANLPNMPRPEVRWENSNPAQELAALCERLGCVVVFNPFQDRVEIHVGGVAQSLPSGPTIGGSVGFDSPAAPDSIRPVSMS